MKQTNSRKPLFISMRWRAILPFAIIVTLVAMLGAYLLASRMTSGFAVSEDTVLIQSSQAVVNRSVTLYERQRSEAQRVAFTEGIAENIIRNNVTALHDTLETLARTANLDSIIVTDPAGLEVAGVLRSNSELLDYSISTQFDISSEPIVQAVIQDEAVGSSSFIRTSQGLLVYVAVPIINDGSFAGVALVGQSIPTLVNSLQASAVAELTIYDAVGSAYYTTLDLDTETLLDLNISEATVNQTLDTPISMPVTLGTTAYRTLYTPFNYGENTLGVVATSVVDNVPFISSIGRQLSAIFVSILTGVAVFLVFNMLDRYARRLNKVSKTATALAVGFRDERTHMKPNDEIGMVAASLDKFASITQEREDQLRTQLWRQRRERNYLLAVFEAIPEGVVVQDKEGAVIMMNDPARELLGTQGNFSNNLAEIRQQVPQTLGRELMAGMYALGKPQQISQDGRMLSAQAAALMTHSKQRIGTVLLLRDITQDVKQEQARERLLTQLSEDIQQPLANLAQSEATRPNPAVRDFAREISRHAAALQKMIVNMRELTKYSPEQARQMHRPLLADTLLYAVANDWRQIAQAANLELRVIINKTGLYLLGDESRLRWAIGNIVDNAIKYTEAGGIVTIEVKDNIDGMIHMRIRDNGVGISAEDIRHAFMPFYRGTPLRADGTMIRVPGMGQGLHLARQVIRAHGGLMKVKSRIGVGSAVYLALPITSGASYTLPILINADMDGETMQIPVDADIEAIWRKK